MNFARLNHILIPTTRHGRQRARRSILGRLLSPLAWLFGALSAEGRALVILSLFVGTAGIEVGRTQVYFLWSVLLGLLGGALVIRFAFPLRNVALSVNCPPRVTTGAPIQFTLTLHNRSARAYHNIRLSGPFLPWDGRWVGQPKSIRTLKPGGRQTVTVSARFVSRGRHELDLFSAAVTAPLGLSLGQRIYDDGTDFNVVPKICSLDSLQLPTGRRYQPGGIAQASSVGEAMELHGVRPYRPGDPIRDLHARTWARTGAPHVREYQQEYYTRIGVVFDDDASSLTEAGLEAGLSLTAGIIAKLSRGEALIDLLVVGGQVHAFTIGRSLGFLSQALDVLACVEPGPKLDAEMLMGRLEPYLTQLSAIVVVTQSKDVSRMALAEDIERRGVGCRLIRIEDDTASWLRKTEPHQAPVSRFVAATVVPASRVLRGETVSL